MKKLIYPAVRLLASIALTGAFAITPLSAAAADESEQWNALGRAVAELLKTGDTNGFVAAAAIAEKDWAGAIADQGTNKAAFPAKSHTERMRAEIARSAGLLLLKAKELNLNFADVPLTTRVDAKRAGRRFFADSDSGDPGWPYLSTVKVIVSVPRDWTEERLRGEYEVSLQQLIETSNGWRLTGGLQWTAFPEGIVDPNTKVEIALMQHASEHRPVDMSVDPALRRFAEVIVESLKRRDPGYFKSNAMADFESIWKMISQQAPPGQLPPRAELENRWKENLEQQVESTLIFQQMENSGIDLADATIEVESARFQYVYQRGPGIDGMDGNNLELQLKVTSEKQSATGKSLSGSYTLGVGEAQRINGKWFASGTMHFKALPPGVVPPEVAENIRVEAYIAEHGAMPPGISAPDVSFVRLSDSGTMKLSEMKGKVVVLDFWATWCGPCQGPMAKMQTYVDKHPEWKDKVAFVALSIDDSRSTLEAHLKKNDWNKTFNVWAGEGGWNSAAPRAFRVRGVPTCYILDREGKVVRSGHPAGLRIEEEVAQLLQ